MSGDLRGPPKYLEPLGDSPVSTANNGINTKSINIMSILKVSNRQVKAARAMLGWSQENLASAAGVSLPTIKRLEAQDGLLGGRDDTGLKIRSALEQSGIEFIDENGGGPGVRLKKRRPK